MIQERPDRPSPYLAQVRAPDGRRVSKSFKRRKDAVNWEKDQLADMRRNDWVDPRGGDISLGQWLAEVEAAKLDVAASTLAKRESLIRNHVAGHRIGGWPIGRLTPEVLQRWVKEKSETLAPATVHTTYTIITEALNLAVARGRLSRSPNIEVSLPKVSKPPHRYLTEKQLWELWESMPARYRPFVLLGGYGGLRPGETLAALWGDVEGRKLNVRGTKTAGSRRTILLPEFVVESLREHRSAFPHVSLILHNKAGNPVDLNHYRNRQWAKAVEAAGFAPMTPHDLRHTHAALLIAQGAHSKAIADRLGHTSIRTTIDVYGHLMEGVEADIIDRLGQPNDNQTANSPPPKERAGG